MTCPYDRGEFADNISETWVVVVPAQTIPPSQPPSQTKLEQAQAYALEVRKRKFQVKRITGAKHG